MGTGRQRQRAGRWWVRPAEIEGRKKSAGPGGEPASRRRGAEKEWGPQTWEERGEVMEGVKARGGREDQRVQGDEGVGKGARVRYESCGSCEWWRGDTRKRKRVW
jgi:hypothetical protein